MLCLLAGILAVPASGEKGTLESTWVETLAKDRSALDSFETWTETWRYDVFDSTAPITIERSEDWVRSLRQSLIRSVTPEAGSRQAISFIVDEARRYFATSPESAEVLSEIHQRQASLGTYWVWERRSGMLSRFEPQGTWHQSEGTIAIGPPLSPESIEVFLAKLGFLVPESSKSLNVPSSTRENQEDFLVLQTDSEGFRFKYGCRPWASRETRIDYLEEYPIDGEEEGGLSEKRFFFRFSMNESERGPVPFVPEAALEFRYDSRGELTSYALIHIHPPVLNSADWMTFPSARPPFGWKVLDYRFLPEKEFVFGDVR